MYKYPLPSATCSKMLYQKYAMTCLRRADHADTEQSCCFHSRPPALAISVICRTPIAHDYICAHLYDYICAHLKPGSERPDLKGFKE